MQTNEPVRWAVYSSAVLGALTGLLGDLGAGVPRWRAFGRALALLVPVVLGTELARTRTFGPRTIDRILDAEAVIAAGPTG